MNRLVWQPIWRAFRCYSRRASKAEMQRPVGDDWWAFLLLGLLFVGSPFFLFLLVIWIGSQR